MQAVLLGCGGVGRAVLRIATSGAETSAFSFLAVLDSSGGIICDGDVALVKAVLAHKEAGHSLASFTGHGKQGLPKDDVVAQIKAQSLKFAVIDTTAADTVEELVSFGASAVVLANKKPAADASAENYKKLVSAATFRHESTVGAGTPILATVRRLRAGLDNPTRIEGCMSGTLGFVCSGLDTGKPLSEVVREAKALGYTEPDPRDDLSGTDVQRKALILARSCGLDHLEMKDVPVEPLYPPSMGPENMDVDAFMANLGSLDTDMTSRVAAAKERGEVLRYCGTVDVAAGKASVELVAVKSDSPLGRLQGADNMFVIHSSIYAERPLVLQGAGAGNECTAIGVLADLKEVI